jgi:hypothetical protein
MVRNQLTASHSDNVMVAIPANVKCWSMTNEENTMYGFNATLRLSFDEAIERVLAALKMEGFGVLSDIDVQYAMKAGRRHAALPPSGARTAGTQPCRQSPIGLSCRNVVVRER